VCIAIQRIFVQQDIYDEFMKRFVEETARLRQGDPLDESTDLGPMITEAAAKRAEAWICEAVDAGARIIAGGKRDGAYLEPTILTQTTPQMQVNAEEVFAPIVTIETYHDFVEAVEKVNDSRFGLQAGVFTQQVRHIFHAYEHIEVGGLVVNDIPTYRIDHMPYGGIKDSGIGREGVRYAIEEMTELKLMALNLSS
jgi:acyl-CoA reductase-like NAD-dependent aldehyde dehydrogenase